MDNNHVLYVRLRTSFVRICTLIAKGGLYISVWNIVLYVSGTGFE